MIGGFGAIQSVHGNEVGTIRASETGVLPTRTSLLHREVMSLPPERRSLSAVPCSQYPSFLTALSPSTASPVRLSYGAPTTALIRRRSARKSALLPLQPQDSPKTLYQQRNRPPSVPAFPTQQCSLPCGALPGLKAASSVASDFPLVPCSDARKAAIKQRKKQKSSMMLWPISCHRYAQAGQTGR